MFSANGKFNRFSFCDCEKRLGTMSHLSNNCLDLQEAVMAVRIKDQIVHDCEMKIHNCVFWSNLTTVFQGIHSSHRKQQVFVVNRLVEILDTTDIPQRKHVSGIHNQADIGTRESNIEEFKGSEWLTGPAGLRQPKHEFPEKFNVNFPQMKRT